MNAWLILLTIFLTALTLAGDVLIKYAIKSDVRAWLLFWSVVLWGVSPYGWYVVLKYERFAIVGAIFSIMSLVGLVIIGLCCFNERLTIKEWVGFSFGLLSIILLSGKI